MILKQFIILCLAVFSMQALRAQNDDSARPDSLFVAFENMPRDTVRLRKLFEVTSQLYTSDTQRCTLFNDLLIEQASEQQNTYYLCKAYLTRIIIACNSYDKETVQKTMEVMAPIARKAKIYDDFFRAWRCAIEVNVLSQDFEHGESEAMQMLREAESLNNKLGIAEAYQCLASIYRLTFRKEKAIELLEKALPLAQSLGEPGPISNILQSLMFLHQETVDKNNTAKWRHSLEDFEQFLLANSDPKAVDPTLLVLYGTYINYYMYVDQMENAGRLIERVDRLYYPYISEPIYRVYFDTPCFKFYQETKEYDKALRRIDAALSDIAKMNGGEDYNNWLNQKAALLDLMGRWNEALPLYKQTASYKDSIQILTINKQYEQLKQSFNADQLELEQAHIRHRTQILTLILLGLGLLVVIYLIVHLLHNRSALRKAEAQMRQMADKMEQVNEAKDRFLSNISSTIRTPLNTVVDGSLRLAMQQVEDPVERQQLSVTIRRMSSGLLNMINDILDLSRLEAGMMKFDPSEVEISSQILDAATSAKTPVDIRIECPKDTLYLVNFDALRLRQVLSSLFDEPDKAEVQIVATLCEQEPKLTLTVSGTALARENPAQDVIIRNEINRMLVVHFGGLYAIRKRGEGQVVVMSIPAEPLRPEKN